MPSTASVCEECGAVTEMPGQLIVALKLRIVLALALDGNGDRTAAFDTLTEALRMASHEGFMRAFLDEGEALMRLLAAWAERGPTQIGSLGVVPAFVAQLLDGVAPAHGRTADSTTGAADLSPYAADAPADALTARELDVLRMISRRPPQPRDRGEAVRLRADGEVASTQNQRQARRGQPYPGSRHRPRERADSLIVEPEQ